MSSGRVPARVRPGEQGIVTAFVIVFAVCLIAVTGLVLDGGRMLSEKREARNIADAAARAGAQELDEFAIRDGNNVVLDGPRAESAACTFLSRAGYDCGSGQTRASAQGNEITVTVEETVNLLLLPVVPQTFVVSGTACVAYGITGAEPTAQC